MHHHLRKFKDAPDELTRDRLALRLAALLSLFMEKHATCVGEWDIAVCPPSQRRVALSPVVAKIRVFSGRSFDALQAHPGHDDRTLDPRRFAINGDLQGTRVLLLDDTFTTGSKLFSAVAALREAGAVVVGPIVLGRHVKPTWAPSAEMLNWLEDRCWDEERCCRCDGERRDEGALF